MTPKQLQDWMDSKGWNKSKVARELGIGRARLDRFLDPDPEENQPIPKYIELAIFALNHGAGERL